MFSRNSFAAMTIQKMVTSNVFSEVNHLCVRGGTKLEKDGRKNKIRTKLHLCARCRQRHVKDLGLSCNEGYENKANVCRKKMPSPTKCEGKHPIGSI